jgi:hypothetical protein
VQSFVLRAIGIVAEKPQELEDEVATHIRFCLIGSDYVGKDEQGNPREVFTKLHFEAFGRIGKAISRAYKGDQLLVRALVCDVPLTHRLLRGQSDRHYIVTGFRWGALVRRRRPKVRGGAALVRGGRQQE